MLPPGSFSLATFWFDIHERSEKEPFKPPHQPPNPSGRRRRQVPSTEPHPHQYAFFASLLAGPLLVPSAATARATVAAAVYAVSICGLFGVSALYHRITWTPQVRRRLRHSTTR
jgi:hypothetical protein